MRKIRYYFLTHHQSLDSFVCISSWRTKYLLRPTCINPLMKHMKDQQLGPFFLLVLFDSALKQSSKWQCAVLSAVLIACNEWKSFRIKLNYINQFNRWWHRLNTFSQSINIMIEIIFIRQYIHYDLTMARNTFKLLDLPITIRSLLILRWKTFCVRVLFSDGNMLDSNK